MSLYKEGHLVFYLIIGDTVILIQHTWANTGIKLEKYNLSCGIDIYLHSSSVQSLYKEGHLVFYLVIGDTVILIQHTWANTGIKLEKYNLSCGIDIYLHSSSVQSLYKEGHLVFYLIIGDTVILIQHTWANTGIKLEKYKISCWIDIYLHSSSVQSLYKEGHLVFYLIIGDTVILIQHTWANTGIQL